MSRSPLVAKAMEFALVPLKNLKNGGSFDRPSILQDNRVGQKFEESILRLSMP